MSESEFAYCRLCADSLPHNMLVDLQMDEGMKQNAIEKVMRLSLEVTNLDSSEDDLPKTVCFPCMESLDTAFDFVVSISESQKRLEAWRPLRARCRLCGAVVCAEHTVNLTRHLRQVHWADPRVRCAAHRRRRGDFGNDRLRRGPLGFRSRSPLTREPTHPKLWSF